LEFLWDFDNNGTIDRVTTTPTTSFVYAPAGTYTVSGFVRDKDGAPAPFTSTFTVPVQPGQTIGAHGQRVYLFGSGPCPGASPQVRGFDTTDGSPKFGFDAYPGFTGGVRTALGDVTGDGVPDIITGVGPGGGPHVKVFDGVTLAEVRSFFAFGAGFSGGLTVAAGDVNGDGTADLIVGAGPGGGAHGQVFP